jgi:hypothetical protein
LIPGLLAPTITDGTESGLSLTFTDGMESGLTPTVTESGPGMSPRSGDTQFELEDPSSSKLELVAISTVDVGSSCFIFRSRGVVIEVTSALPFP